MLSWLVHGDRQTPVTGLRAFPPLDRPPVQIVFQSYHAMVAIGMALIGLAALGLALLRKDRLLRYPWLLRLLVLAVLLPQAGNQLGWMSAEIGRQPWIVYGLLRTSDAVSRVVTAGQILWSIVMFALVYALLLAVFLFLLDQKIRHGPAAAAHEQAPDGPIGAGRRA
jgi:cytochrome d ubiquinol oxidase subunit I